MLSNGHALVADFGIARAVEREAARSSPRPAWTVGTPVYMSPEQAVGEKVGPTADLYSLGCMLYEMLAGEPPFTGKNATQIMAKHAMEQPAEHPGGAAVGAGRGRGGHLRGPRQVAGRPAPDAPPPSARSSARPSAPRDHAGRGAHQAPGASPPGPPDI